MELMNCPYRKHTKCEYPSTYDDGENCNKCLSGMIADNTDLLITAIANLTASIEERLCREEQK